MIIFLFAFKKSDSVIYFYYHHLKNYEKLMLCQQNLKIKFKYIELKLIKRLGVFRISVVVSQCSRIFHCLSCLIVRAYNCIDKVLFYIYI